ncbi:MAG: NAD(P)H-dependent oxidoreductase [Desulfovibrio sp.]|nr:NAD(P)H-dependent oxidoreductase [Desulfovibrio sp.]
MANIVLCNASPHRHGVCDALTDCLQKVLSTQTVHTILLRDHHITPCQGCRHCSQTGNVCRLDQPGDAAKSLLEQLAQARFLLFLAPIYFYALPAHAKALVDRSQRFYAQPLPHIPHSTKTLVLLTAARQKGEQLFTGTLLTLRYFLAQLGREITQAKTLRGLDVRQDFLTNQALQNELAAWLRQWLMT